MSLSAVQLVRNIRLLRLRTALVIKGGTLRSGREFIVGSNPRIARRATLHVGDRVSIASDLVLQAHLTTGNDVMISSCVAAIGDDHPFDSSEKTIQEFDSRPLSMIKLHGDNLIGFGTILIGPLEIGKGTIVGAGSIVTSDLPPNTVCTGRPAKPIKLRR